MTRKFHQHALDFAVQLSLSKALIKLENPRHTKTVLLNPCNSQFPSMTLSTLKNISLIWLVQRISKKLRR